MSRLTMKSLLALTFMTLTFGACSATERKPEPSAGPTEEEINVALKEQLGQMIELVQKYRDKLGGPDLDRVTIVPIDRLEMNIQSYVNDTFVRVLTELFIDQNSEGEYVAGHSDLAVEPYDSRTFYRLMQTAGVRQVEDLVIPDNQRKIAALVEKEGAFVHGFARMILEETLGGDYRVRIQFVPLNGSTPIRTKGSSLKRAK